MYFHHIFKDDHLTIFCHRNQREKIKSMSLEFIKLGFYIIKKIYIYLNIFMETYIVDLVVGNLLKLVEIFSKVMQNILGIFSAFKTALLVI